MKMTMIEDTVSWIPADRDRAYKPHDLDLKKLPLIYLFDSEGRDSSVSLQLLRFQENWPMVYWFVLTEAEKLNVTIDKLSEESSRHRLKHLLKKFIVAFLEQVERAMNDSGAGRAKKVNVFIVAFVDGMNAIGQLAKLSEGKPIDSPFFSAFPEYLNSVDHSLEVLTQPAIELILAHAFFLGADKEAWKDEARKFYGELAEALYENADQTTANRRAQITACQSVIEALLAKGVMKDNYRMADIGCGNCEFLFQLLSALERDRLNLPEKLFGVDLNPTAFDGGGATGLPKPTLIQMSFLDDELIRHLANIDLALMIWSPLNDVPLVMQGEAMENLSRVLTDGGVLVIDVPLGYEREVMATHRQHVLGAFGQMQKAFRGAGEASYVKSFSITPLQVLIHLAKQAGLFLYSNLSAMGYDNGCFHYKTATGQDRVFVALRKT